MAFPGLKSRVESNLALLIPRKSGGLSFGVSELDRLLPGGLPRGQLTTMEAPLGSGGTALILALAEQTLRADEGVAFVDAARSLAPQSAAHLSAMGRFWVVRPRGTQSAWWCADILLRTGAFGLVVVDQSPALPRTIGRRLQLLARDKDAVVLIRPITHAVHSMHAQPAVFSASVRLRVCASGDVFIPAIPGAGAAWLASRSIRVSLEKGGAPRAAEVQLAISLPHRLRPHWAVRDRRAGTSAGGRAGRRSAKHR